MIGLLIGFNYYGLVAEQVDAADLESVALVRVGSIPSEFTKFKKTYIL